MCNLGNAGMASFEGRGEPQQLLQESKQMEGVLLDRIVKDQPIIGDRDTSDWDRANAIRQWAYEYVAWGSEQLLIEHDGRTLVELLEPILADRAVVWCGGA